MMRPVPAPAPVRRHGVILLIVITMLTLFAVVGLAFVLYSEAEATASRIWREAQAITANSSDPFAAEPLLNFAAGQLIYGPEENNLAALNSAMRGHNLARDMFGYDSYNPHTNINPFNGVGRLRNAPVPGSNPNLTGENEFNLVNYQFFGVLGTDNVHDPERWGWRNSSAALNTNAWAGGMNSAYTYPDQNHMFLGAVKADGTVLIPSFHRPWLFDDGINGTALNVPANANWTNVAGKYRILRPRPADMDPAFPMPGDATGDVKNLFGTPGGNDSIWMDLGYPLQTIPGTTTKFKPLFAYFVTDLDNRVNVNVHGNVRGQVAGTQKTHGSNQGWTPGEVSIKQVMTLGMGGNEYSNLLVGNGTLQGRYGAFDSANQQPNEPPPPGNVGNSASPYTAPAGTAMPRFYNAVDLDGVYELDSASSFATGFPATSSLLLPQLPTATWISAFPGTGLGATYPPGYGFGSNKERKYLPAIYNPIRQEGDDKFYDASNMKKLLYIGPSGSEALTSMLGQLCPTNLADTRIQRLLTTHSFDLNRPGVTPYIWDPADAARQYLFPATIPYPKGGGATPTPYTFPTPPAPPPAGSEFGSDWRHAYAALGKVNLNRKLADYPQRGANGIIDLSVAANATAFTTAQTERQTLARDIFLRLRYVTGARDPATVGLAADEVTALRWLAQLSANIVDYIDSDDYSTPFNWNPSTADPNLAADLQDPNRAVYGTELPRLVINEVYSEFANDPMDTMAPATRPYHMNFWVELHNPFNRDDNSPPLAEVDNAGSPANSAARLELPVSGAAQYGAYQVVIAKYDGVESAALRSPDNILGSLPAASMNIMSIVSNYDPETGFMPQAGVDTRLVLPSNGSYGGTAADNGRNNGFYVLGPNDNFPQSAGAMNPPLATLKVKDNLQANGPARNAMNYTVDVTMPYMPATLPKHTILLRRLACPHIPANPPPGGMLNAALPYNPYITVDYLENLDTNYGLQFDNTMMAPPTTPIHQRYAMGKKQPYASHSSQHKKYYDATAMASVLLPPLGNQPQHTLFRHNAQENTAAQGGSAPPPAAGATQTLTIPFDWLTHFDRELQNPAELLQVSAYKQHELTQQFIVDVNTNGTIEDPSERFLHRAPWYDQDARISRAFEYFTTPYRMSGMQTLGRHAGKINPNTIWDVETFRALCDPTASNVFDINLVNTIFTQLSTVSRTKGAGGAISANDRPFRGFAAPYTGAAGDTQYPIANFGPTGIGLEDTIFRSFDGSGTGARLLDVPLAQYNAVPNANPSTLSNPHLQNQLLTKIFSNLTTRSNVFAVWLTVGFFEVRDDTTNPVKLGPEVVLGGQTIRHKFFFLVDRTQVHISGGLVNDSTTLTKSNTEVVDPNNLTPPTTPGTPGPGQAPVPVTITPAAMSGTQLSLNVNGTPTNFTWSLDGSAAQIQLGVGSQLIVDPGPNQEVIVVTEVNNPPGTFKALFNRPHSKDFYITIPGHPGPQPYFNARNPNYAAIVPYFTIIE